MNGAKLVKMANEIAAFYASEPDRAAAIEGVASHLKRFWEPRMRREILAIFDAGGEEMAPLVAEAIAANRERLTPADA